MNPRNIKIIIQALSNIESRDSFSKCFSDDIETSKRNLSDNKYQTFDQFREELYASLIKVSDASPFQSFVDYFFMQLDKELKKLHYYDKQTWCNLVLKYYKKYGAQLSASQKVNVPLSYKEKFKNVIPNKENATLITHQKLETLAVKLQNQNDINTKQEIIRVIKEKEPHINVEKANIDVCLTTLKFSTIQLLAKLVGDTI